MYSNVPWSLDSILRKCLDPDPANRYARAADLAEDLCRFLQDLPLKHARAAASANACECGSAATRGLAVPLRSRWSGLSCSSGWETCSGSPRITCAQLRLGCTAPPFKPHLTRPSYCSTPRAGPPSTWPGGSRTARAFDLWSGRARRLDARELVTRLPARDRDTLREEMAEMVLLVARARVYRAEQSHDERARERTLQGGHRLARPCRVVRPAPRGGAVR